MRADQPLLNVPIYAASLLQSAIVLTSSSVINIYFLCSAENIISAPRDKIDRTRVPTTAMFRRPRETEPDRFSKRLSETLQPLTVIPWGGLAMCYLGVPIAIGASMVVVQDNDYTAAIEKLEGAGFNRSVPNRAPPPEIMEDHPSPQHIYCSYMH